MTAQEEAEALALDMRMIEQICLSDAWKVINKYLGYGIERHFNMLLAPGLDPLKNEAIKARVVIYKELLDLPNYIEREFKAMKAATSFENGGETPPTEP